MNYTSVYNSYEYIIIQVQLSMHVHTPYRDHMRVKQILCKLVRESEGHK